MSDLRQQAMLFFEACERGAGWEGCRDYCHADATFSAQSTVLAEINSLQGYTEWMQHILQTIPDGQYKLHCFAVDEEHQCVTAYAVYSGTHTGPGGPVEPTGKSFSADYVYVMQFDGALIRHMTKIWNDAISLQQLGWA